MSDIEHVSWKLNDLLEAGKKAKAFAAVEAEGESRQSTSISGFALTTYSPAGLADEAEEVVAEELALSDGDAETIDAPDLDKEDLMLIEQDISPLSDEEQLRALEESDLYKQRIQEVRETAFKEGHLKGQEEGKADWQESVGLLNEFVEKMRTASEDKTQFFEPLKKLSLHIAKHLVRGELSVSGLAVERLVLESLNLIEKNTKGVITVYLSTNDRKRYGEVATSNERLDLQEDPSLSSGSLRLGFEESAVEDLIEDRLSTLSKMILDQSDGWKIKAEDLEPVSVSSNVEVETEIIDMDSEVALAHVIEEKEESGLGEPIEDGEILTVTQDSSHSDQVTADDVVLNGPEIKSVKEEANSTDSLTEEDTSVVDNNL